MSIYETIIEELKAAKVIKQDCRLNNSSILNKNYNYGLNEKIISFTSFLPIESHSTRRIVHITSKLHTIPLCVICSNKEQIWKKIYYLSTCSKECACKLKSASIKQMHIDNPDFKFSRARKIVDNLAVKDENGISKSRKRALKVAKTKRNTFINGKSVAQIQSEKTTISKIKNGLNIDPEKLQEVTRYTRRIRNITEKQPYQLLENINNRARNGADTFQLDHKFSICMGFKFGIPEQIIGNIVNLECIPTNINKGKGAKCSITLDELLTSYCNYMMST